MTDVLTRDLVVVPGTARTKDEAIREAGELLVRAGAVTPSYVESMAERERSMSTYMGSFLAIPHGTDESKAQIVRSALCLVRYDEPISWGPVVARRAHRRRERDARRVPVQARVTRGGGDPTGPDIGGHG